MNGVATTFASFVPSLGGYMTFIGGPHGYCPFGSPVTSTVLRSSGSLFTGSQPVINVFSGNITQFNNPYASPLLIFVRYPPHPIFFTYGIPIVAERLD